MKTAKQIMMTPIVAVSPSMSLSELEEFFASEGVSGAPVKSETGEIIGIVSKTDIIQTVRLQKTEKFSELFAPEQTVADIMNYGVFYVAPEAPVRSVADIMINQQIHRVLVGDANHVVGIISSHDLLDLLG